MKVLPIKTRAMVPPRDDLDELLEESLPQVKEKSVVVVTSKIVAIHQGRCVPYESDEQRDKLAREEADWFVPRKATTSREIMFTRMGNVLVASAGIDRSNGNGYLVLWPKEPIAEAKRIRGYIKAKMGINDLGVIITDSHVTMMRTGVLGVSIGHFGFNPVRDYVGNKDIFGREFHFERTNVVDALATAAVLEMGEGEEGTPLAVISEINDIEFTEDETRNAGVPPLQVSYNEDLFKPMLEALPWEKGKGGWK